MPETTNHSTRKHQIHYLPSPLTFLCACRYRAKLRNPFITLENLSNVRDLHSTSVLRRNACELDVSSAQSTSRLRLNSLTHDNTEFSMESKVSNIAHESYHAFGTDVEVVPENYDQESLLKRLADKFGSAFYVVDLGCVRQQLTQWRELLPRAHPYYAIKCNPNPVIIRLLASYGVNFDCASEGEIRLVLAAGVAPERIIFANPCKFPAHIKAARALGVNMMTFDNEDELIKIAKCNPDAQVVMRIATDDSKAKCRFSSKFGAQYKDWEALVLKAIKLRLDLIGVSFHVGSGSSDDTVYPTTLRACRQLFDLAAEHGVTMTFLDIGGGFPGVADWNPSFPQLADGMRPVMDELFPNTVRIIGEPGRYFVARSHALCVNVTSRRLTSADSGDNILYYVDDGVYGSFSCKPFDHYDPEPLIFTENRQREVRKSTIFGPTCDSLDCIGKEFMMPVVEPGEWLYFNIMGAYTCASTTQFNGFCTRQFHYIDSDPLACEAYAMKDESVEESDASDSSSDEAVER